MLLRSKGNASSSNRLFDEPQWQAPDNGLSGIWKIAGMWSLMCWVLLGTLASSVAQDNRVGSPKKVGVIETPELSQLVVERMAEVKKSQADGKAPPQPKFVLVDVRSDREMSVSVIPGAISQSEFEKNLEKYRGMVVIPYCTVGGRCGEFSRQLAQAGWTVRSYRGSIVEWVQNELPLVTRKGESTNQVHTNGGKFKLPAKYRAVSS